jgi:hypothetical protein
VEALAADQFSDIDTGGTGSISEPQLQQALAATQSASGISSSPAATSAQAERLFEKIDTNGDGTISPDEWAAFQQKVQTREQSQAYGPAGAGAATGSTSAPNLAQSLKNLEQNIVAQLYQNANHHNGRLSQSQVANLLV